MAKQNLILGLILGGCVAAVACSSDGDDTSTPAGGAAGAATGGNAGSHAGGTGGGTPVAGSGGTTAGAGANEAGTGGSVSTAGASEGGAGGAAPTGEAGAGGEAGAAVVVVPPPPLNPHVVVVPAAAPTTLNHLLVGGTDYATTEVVDITLSPSAVGDTTTYSDGDVGPVTSGGLSFVLERTNDVANLMDGGKVHTAFDLRDAGTDTTPLLPANKAYVGLYNKSLISILNLTTGKVSRRIDLSAYYYATDSDGSVDIQDGVYDANKKIAYFLLQNIDIYVYPLACTAEKAMIVGIDATTDEIVDLNGAADGKAIQLSVVNPQKLMISADGTKLTTFGEGCDVGTGAYAVHQNAGVEIYDLVALTSNVAYASTNGDYYTDLLLIGGNNALIAANDLWYKLDLGTGVLGAALTGAPPSAVFDGTDLIGVNVTGNVGAVVRYGVSSGITTPITATSWSGQYDTVAGLALVP